MKSSKSVIQKRQNRIIQYLQENQEADAPFLASWLDVSEITIRRDLEALTRQGLTERYFGGVRLSRPAAGEQRTAASGAEHMLPAGQEDLRDVIAARAAAMIQNHDVVFINSSSTALRVVKFLRGQNVVIVTNNARIVSLPHDPQVEIILTGGEVYGNKRSLVGEFALNTLMRIKATKCIIGVSGISVKGGITSEVLQETAINQMMLKRCSGDKIVVADGSKIGIERNFLSGSITDINWLITDGTADNAELESMKAKGVKIEMIDSQKEDGGAHEN